MGGLPVPRAAAARGSGYSMAGPGILRVLSWNVWWRFGAWQQRREAITAVLADAAADILCLQEVWADGDQSLVDNLATRLDMHCAVVPSPASQLWQERVGGTTATIGNAILSSWPITQTEVVHLPTGAAADEGRTALFARVDTPFGSVPVFTTQFNSHPAQSAVRVEQANALAAFVAEHDVDRFPPVVTGDLNAEPDSDEVRKLCGHKTAPASPGLVLVDAWRYADPGDPGWTWDRANPHVRATHEPSSRIDYVLVGLPGPAGTGTPASASCARRRGAAARGRG